MILQNIGTIVTLLFGIQALIYPRVLARGLSMDLIGNKGSAEIRIGFGGPMIALSLGALIYQLEIGFIFVGLFWLGAAIVRLIAIILDGLKIDRRYGLYFSIEVIVAACCIGPYLG